MAKRRRWFGYTGGLAILISIVGYITAATPWDHTESAPLMQVADVPLPGPIDGHPRLRIMAPSGTH
jgi:hypothetical protein